MKKRYLNSTALFIVIVAITLGFSSCQKFLNPTPPSLFSPSTVFGTVDNAKLAVLGAYQDLAGDQGYGNRISCYYPYDNDETMGPTKIGDNDRGDIAHYNETALNLQLYAPYVQLYQGIERANICIYYIPQMALYDSGNAQQQGELQRLYGEALTLRAQFYLELLRNWGDLPEQRLPSEVSGNLFIPKTNRDTIYNHLLNDLLIAENLVPWRSQIGTLGDQADERITKGAVKALRAKIALVRGGFELRKDKQIERELDYLQFYQIAWNECNDIINSGQHALNPSFKSIFKDGLCSHTLDAYNEILFQVGMAGGTGLTDSRLGTYDGPLFGGYVSSSNATTPTITYPEGSGTLEMLPTYFYLFDSTDTRRDVTFAPYDVMADYSKNGEKLTKIRDGKFRSDWVSNPGPSTSLYWGIDWPLIRYSDVLLMFAEADNELNQKPSPAAISAFEQVRTRGYGGNASLIGTTPTDYIGFFLAIKRERSLEFGAEGIRKYDLKRWGLLGTALQQTTANLTSLMNNKQMSTTTYMASPPSYVLSASLPTSMYIYNADSPENPGGGYTGSVDNSSLWFNSFYYKAPSTSKIPSNTTKESWIGTGISSTFLTYYGIGFVPNHSELFPIPQAVIDASNGTLTQDYGY